MMERAGTVQSRRPVTCLVNTCTPSRAVKTYGLSTQLNLLFGVPGACIKVNVDAAKLLSANAAGFGLIVGMVTVFLVLGAKTIRSFRQLQVRQWRLDMESFLHWKWDSQM